MQDSGRPPTHGHAFNVKDELSTEEIQELERRSWLPAPLVYQIVRQEGQRELSRPLGALWWSGIAAGVTIGLSVYAEAVLHVHLPDADWRHLVENLGYCTGFLIVILSRHQLFTENTITPILPLMVQRTWACFFAVLRLWLIVAAANLAGAVIFALFWTYSGVTGEETLRAMQGIGRHTMENDLLQMAVKSIAAGFLMASLVWIMPSATGAEFWAITLIIYLIAVGDLVHIVSGGVEVLMLVFSGETGVLEFLFRFGIPSFVGNVIGGTALFSLIVYAQVRREIRATAGK